MATVIKSKKPRKKRVSKKQAMKLLEEFDKQADEKNVQNIDTEEPKVEPKVEEPKVEEVQDEEPQEKPKKVKKKKNDKKIKAGKNSAKKSKWLQHVRGFRKLHPEMKYKDVLKLASKTYERE